MTLTRCVPQPANERQLDQLVEIEQPGAKAVVDVVIVVGDVVGDRGDLRLQARPGSKLEVELGIGFAQRPGRVGDRAVVLGQAFKRFPAEVEAIEIRIGRLEVGEDPQRVRVMIEAAAIGERRGQRVLAGMAERRMAEVVSEAQGFGQVFIKAQRPGDGAPDLRDLEAVRQPDPEMVAVGGDEDLRLVAKAAEGDRMDDAVAVALEDVARAARARLRLGMKAAARPRSDAAATPDGSFIP